jgi:hypothetical protein
VITSGNGEAITGGDDGGAFLFFEVTLSDIMMARLYE